jgi:hypothetical protein
MMMIPMRDARRGMNNICLCNANKENREKISKETKVWVHRLNERFNNDIGSVRLQSYRARRRESKVEVGKVEWVDRWMAGSL